MKKVTGIIIVLMFAISLAAFAAAEDKPVKKLIKKRVIPESELRQAERKFEAAKERLAEKVSAVGEKKQGFEGIKESYRACKNETDAACNATRENMLNHSREIVINMADALISHLNKIKEKAASNANINDTELSGIIAEIDAAIAELEAAKAAPATTKEGIKSAASAVRDIWKKFEHKAVMHAYRIVRADAREIIMRAEKLKNKFDKLLSYAAGKGISTDGMQAMLDSFSLKLNGAKDKYSQSQLMFQAAVALRKNATADGNITEDESSSIINKVKGARKLAQAAQKELKDAHEILVELSKEIRSKARVRLTDRQLTDPETPLPEEVGVVNETVEEIELIG